MRIIAGEFKGRRLASPKNGGTRPALELLRGALFDILEGDLPGARVLDLFSGTGSLGLEAISRGAAHATFVERSRSASGVLGKNIRSLRLRQRTEVRTADVLRLPRGAFAARFDLILLDPPFPIADDHDYHRLVERAHQHWLADDGLLVQRLPSGNGPPALRPGLERLRDRRHGDSLLIIDWLRVEPEPAPDGADASPAPTAEAAPASEPEPEAGQEPSAAPIS